MKTIISQLLVALWFTSSSLRAGSADEGKADCRAPDSGWALEVQAAQIFGVKNPENYHLSAQYLTLVYRPALTLATVGGWELRPEFGISAVGEVVLHGPENHYFGGALRGRLVAAPLASRWALYLEIGGGAGAIDSTGTRYGQGQDFTFNLLGGAGVRYACTPRCTVGLGVHYQHLSNADLSEPEARNTGLDAYGPSVTFGWAF